MSIERWFLWFLGFSFVAGAAVGVLVPDLTEYQRWASSALIAIAGYCLIRAAGERR